MLEGEPPNREYFEEDDDGDEHGEEAIERLSQKGRRWRGARGMDKWGGRERWVIEHTLDGGGSAGGSGSSRSMKNLGQIRGLWRFDVQSFQIGRAHV